MSRVSVSSLSSALNYPNSNLVRHPRAIVTINDIQIKWTDIEITTTTFYYADTFSVTLPLNSQPPILNLNYWASSEIFSVKIYIGFPPDPNLYSTQDLELFIMGDTNDVEVDLRRSTVYITGRDLSSRLIDAKVTNRFANNTASQIATIFANQNNLTPQVTDTKNPVGVLFNNQQVLLGNNITQWDFLTFLAQQQNYVLFVNNETLVFEPRPTSTDNPYTITYQYPSPLQNQYSPIINSQEIRVGRIMNICGGVSVKITVPYSVRTGASFSVYAKSSHRTRNSVPPLPTSSRIEKRSYIFPGLTQQQAQEKANQLLENILLHEVRLYLELPGDNVLKKDSIIKLTGTNTAYDQSYYPDEIIRTLNIDSGYSMTVNAKNKSQDAEVSQ